MENRIVFEDLGLIDYMEAWDLQEERFNALVEYKRNFPGRDRESAAVNQEPVEPPTQYLLFCEHPHVYTLGKSGDEMNLLIHKEFLKKIEATYYKTNRGGDITYHGPGQIVGYPILDLDSLGLGLKEYISVLEQSIIDLLEQYGISSARLEGATGVWLDADHPVKARKICAIGVRSSRYVTMHGFALNVATDLDYFSYINPCGFDTRGVTSLSKELGEEVEMEAVRSRLKKLLMERFLAPAGPGAS